MGKAKEISQHRMGRRRQVGDGRGGAAVLLLSAVQLPVVNHG